MRKEFVFVLMFVLMFSLVAGAGYNVVVPAAAAAEVSSGGGGGGGGASAGFTYTFSYDVETGELIVHKAVRANDKIQFEVPVGGSSAIGGSSGSVGNVVLVNHTVTMNKVTQTYAEMTVRSDPVNVNLSIGESEKLSLETPGYYDILIKLEGIASLRANITVMSIYEEIPAGEEGSVVGDEGGIVDAISDGVDDVADFVKGLSWVAVIIVLIVLLIIGGAVWFFLKDRRKKFVEIRAKKK